MVEYWRVRVDVLAIRRTILDDLASPGVELADISPRDRGEPDVAVFIGNQPVRGRVRGLQRIFLEFTSSSDRAGPACSPLVPCTRASHRGPVLDRAAATSAFGTSYSWILTFNVPTVVELASVAANVNKHSLCRVMHTPPWQNIPELAFPRSVPTEASDVKWGTIAKDLESMVNHNSMDRAIFLFHTPPYDTALDRAALDGRTHETRRIGRARRKHRGQAIYRAAPAIAHVARSCT